MARCRFWIGAVLAFAGAAGAAAATDLGLEHFERLSQDLRGHRMRPEERRSVAAALARDPEAAYAAQVDAWLTKDALAGYVQTFLRFPPVAVATPDAEPFFHRLAKPAGEGVYHLPHQPACKVAEAIRVVPWWQGQAIPVCPESFRPEVVFDEIGYCSGEAEPLMRQPPRPGCGCGPSLIGCLPPPGERPVLDARVATSVMEEWTETAARIVAEGRPLDELVTTSRTWQTGLVEFLYLRRQLIGELREHGWSAERGRDVAARVRAVEVEAPGRWIERGGVYRGSGLWWTSMAPHALKIPLRGTAHHLLTRHLCSAFSAVNVDADAILAAVGDRHRNLRTLSSLLEAPMRFQVGCSGCHAPMDGAAAFLPEIEAPLYGSHPTGRRAAGELFVTGAEDFRGRGEGIAALARLVVQQPEFEACAVRRALEEVLQRPVKSHDQELLDQLTAEFRRNGHRWVPIVRRLLLSPAYRDTAATPARAAAAPAAVPAVVTSVIGHTCARCHGPLHHLDLSQVPGPDEVAVWKRILTRVGESSMPPPATSGAVADRFPLDPSVRRAFLDAVRGLLGPALDGWEPPRRTGHRAWLSVVHDLAAPTVGTAGVDVILEPLAGKDGFFAKLPARGLPPTYLLAVERASEAVCRGVAKVALLPVEELLTRVYGGAPRPDQVAEGRRHLARFAELAQSPAEAWTALCATHLSGPKLFFELHTPGGRP